MKAKSVNARNACTGSSAPNAFGPCGDRAYPAKQPFSLPMCQNPPDRFAADGAADASRDAKKPSYSGSEFPYGAPLFRESNRSFQDTAMIYAHLKAGF